MQTPVILEAQRHKRWFERLRQSPVEMRIDVQPIGVEPSSNVQRDQSNDFEFYLYVACYPHHCATIHKGLCHRRAGQRGQRLGPFPTKEAALEQANSLRGVRSIHLCERCKP
jgi:hypothetical protein